MNRNEWNKTATEQNAQAEQIGAALAFGCVGIPLILLAVLIFIVMLVG